MSVSGRRVRAIYRKELREYRRKASVVWGWRSSRSSSCSSR
jgi:hypothetical protein